MAGGETPPLPPRTVLLLLLLLTAEEVCPRERFSPPFSTSFSFPLLSPLSSSYPSSFSFFLQAAEISQTGGGKENTERTPLDYFVSDAQPRQKHYDSKIADRPQVRKIAHTVGIGIKNCTVPSSGGKRALTKQRREGRETGERCFFGACALLAEEKREEKERRPPLYPAQPFRLMEKERRKKPTPPTCSSSSSCTWVTTFGKSVGRKGEGAAHSQVIMYKGGST